MSGWWTRLFGGPGTAFLVLAGVTALADAAEGRYGWLHQGAYSYLAEMAMLSAAFGVTWLVLDAAARTRVVWVRRLGWLSVGLQATANALAAIGAAGLSGAWELPASLDGLGLWFHPAVAGAAYMIYGGYLAMASLIPVPLALVLVALPPWRVRPT